MVMRAVYGRPWLPGDDQQLRDLVSAGADLHTITHTAGRSKDAVLERLYYLELPQPRRRLLKLKLA